MAKPLYIKVEDVMINRKYVSYAMNGIKDNKPCVIVAMKTRMSYVYLYTTSLAELLGRLNN